MGQEPTDDDLRAQLIEARVKLNRQIALLEAPARPQYGAGNREVIGELQHELSEVEDALARLDGPVGEDAEPRDDAAHPANFSAALANDDGSQPLVNTPDVISAPARGGIAWMMIAAALAIAVAVAIAWMLTASPFGRSTAAPAVSASGGR